MKTQKTYLDAAKIPDLISHGWSVESCNPSQLQVALDSLYAHGLKEGLDRVIAGDALAVVVPHAYPAGACAKIVRALERRNKQFTRYAVEPRLAKLHEPMFEAAPAGRMEAYYGSAYEINTSIQKEVHPLAAPNWLCNSALDVAWPAGARLMRVGGRTCPYGIVRRVDGGGAIGIHCDRSDWDYPVSEFVNARTTLSCLIYLSDFKGGELELWRVKVHDRELYEALRDPQSGYALDRKRVGEPALTIPVGIGMAVIFDARRLHAVRAVAPGSTPRYSMSGFINVPLADQPLGLYH